MKKLIAIAVLTLFAQVVQADTLLKFKDGSANVWDNIYTKGNQYCTKKSLGEICADKRDVVLKKEVPAGTDPVDFGNASHGALQGQSDNVHAGQHDQEAVDKKKKKSTFQEIDGFAERMTSGSGIKSKDQWW